MAAPGRGVILAGSVFGLGGVWLGVSTARLLANADPGGFSASAPARVAVVLAAGWSLIAMGVATLGVPGRQASARLRVLAGFAWFAAFWDAPTSGEALFAAALIGSTVAPVLVGHAILRDRWRILGPGSRIVVAAGYVATAGAGLLGAAVFDPAAQGCAGCPANPWLVTSSPTMVEVTGRVAILAGAVWSTALAVLVLRLLIVRGPFTPADLPAMLLALIYLCLVVAGYWHAWGDPYLPSDAWTASLATVQAAALTMACLGGLWSPIHRRLVRSRVADLVARSIPTTAPGGLQELLAQVLRDRSVRVWYPLTSGVLVDATGHPIVPVPELELVPLTRRGQVLAVLGHRHGSLRRPDLIDAVTATASLLLDAERLRAQRQWQLLELERSRQRIETAVAEERRRLERDLHDGAQQHLVTAAIAVSLAMLRTTDPQRMKGLEQVRQRLDDATTDLRDVVQGLRAQATSR